MVISHVVVALCCLLQLILAQTTTSDSTQCSYVYGNWTDCIVSSVQTRSVICVCGGVQSDLVECNVTQPIVQQDCACKWKWSKWSKCTAECGGGNTTRVPSCYCNDVSADDANCDLNFYFGRETVSCNEYECGDIPALNKLYWLSIANYEDWPIENGIFNCSLGFDPTDSPKGKTYYQVLSDPQPSSHKHPEWYFLAKEWIAAKLNLANGVQFPLDGVQVILQAGELLENCSGYSEDQIPQVYAIKEKLGRLNNNIGGLNNVDSQMTMLLGGNLNGGDTETRLTFILAIAVPLAAILIVAVALGLTIYYVRQKTNAVAIDKFESDDEEETNLTNQTDLPVGEPTAQDSPNDASDGDDNDN